MSSRPARVGIGAESQAAGPLCTAPRQCQVPQQHRRRCARRLVHATMNGTAASDIASASALSTRFEDFILRTQDGIIKVTAFLGRDEGNWLTYPESRTMLDERRHAPESARPLFRLVHASPPNSRALHCRRPSSWTAAGRRSCATAGSGRAPTWARATASRACWRAETCLRR